MALVQKVIGGVEKAGVKMVGKGRASIERLTNSGSIEEVEKRISDIAEQTGQRIGQIDQRVQNSVNLDRTYKEKLKEARTGGNSAVDEAINVDSNATKPPKDPTPLADNGGVVYEQDGQGVGGASAKKEKFERVRQEVALPYDLPHAENLKNAQDIAGPDKSGILDMVRVHPFISAGIAGGVGVLGANLFDDDDE